VKISANFTLDEFTRSAIATKKKIPNKPDKDALENIKSLVKHVLQPLRDKINVPIKIHSGYRSEEVNRLVGGVPDSDHRCKDLKAAADITAKGISNDRLATIISEMELPVEQVIVEYDQGVLHVSARRPKAEYLSRKKVGSQLVYSLFDPKAVVVKTKASKRKSLKKTAKKKSASKSSRRKK